MSKSKWFVFMVMLVCVTSGVFAQDAVVVDQVVTAQQIAAANGSDESSPNEITVTADGNLVFTETSEDNNDRVYLADMSTDPPTLTLITDGNALAAKVAEFTPSAPEDVSIQGLGVDEDGYIIIGADQSAEAGLVFRVNPGTGNIGLLAGLDGPMGQTSVEGIATIAVRGRTAYVVLEANFGAGNGDSIATVSVDAADGGQTPAEEFVSEDTFREVEGFFADLAFRVVGFLPNGNLVLANAATRDASDNLLEINLETGEVSVLVAATDIEADLDTPDIGPNGGGIDPDGTIYLTNAFGVGDSDNGVIVIRNAGAGEGDASLLASEGDIAGSPGIFDINGDPLSRLFIINGAAVSSGEGEITFVEGNCDCLIRVKEVVAGEGY